MAGADLIPNEQVHVWDIDNGARFVTYVIEGTPGSGDMQVNGAAARLVQRGQKVIVASFGAYDDRDLETYSPIVVHVDAENRTVRVDSNPGVLLGDFVPAWDSEELPGAFTGSNDSGRLA